MTFQDVPSLLTVIDARAGNKFSSLADTPITLHV
jgi:hypothetical protein